jgi:hypothetical protein
MTRYKKLPLIHKIHCGLYNELLEKNNSLYIQIENLMNLVNKLEIKNEKFINKNSINNDRKNIEKKFNLKVLNTYLDKFIDFNKSISELNTNLNYKKIRNINFPSEISENIVKYCIFNKYKLMPDWDTTLSGDLNLQLNNKNIKIEVKAFSSKGPISFGPNEFWDWIYFVDAHNYRQKHFKIYELKLSSLDINWLNIKVNKKETIKDQQLLKRRPRIGFDLLLIQLKKNNIDYDILFDSTIDIL